MADTMEAVQVTEKGGDLELVERDVPSPGPGDVLVKGPGVRRLPQ